MLLPCQPRSLSRKKIKSLRQKGFIPAVIYGHNIKPSLVSVEYSPFEKLYGEAGASSLIDLKIGEEEPTKVLIQEVQRDPLTLRLIHVDFLGVKTTEKVMAEIALDFKGEAPAVREKEGVLIKNLDKIKVESFPQDLVPKIEVDISNLKTFKDIIYVRDLQIPSKIKVLEKENEVVALVSPPRREEEIEKLEEKPEEKVEEVEKAGEEGGDRQDQKS